MADVFYAKQEDYIFRLNKMAADLQAAFTTVQADWNAVSGPTVIQNKPNIGGTGGASLIGTTPSGSLSATNVQAAINELDAEKEPAIAAASVAPTGKYWRGDKSWQDFATDTRGAVLTGLSTTTSGLVTASDSVLSAIGKLQNRVGDSGGFTFRNRVVNGACLVQTRPAVSTGPTGITTYSAVDRFRTVSTSGSGLTFSQSVSSITFEGGVKPAVRQTVTTPATNFSGSDACNGIGQIIEGVNCFDLKVKPFVLSFIFNSNITGTFSVAIRDGVNAYTYLTAFSNTANTPQRVEIKIPTPLGAVTIPSTNLAGLNITIGGQNSQNLRTSTSTSWQTGNFIASTGQSLWATQSGAYIEVTELQLEAGTLRTEFETRNYATEANICARYYEILTYGFIGYGGAATNFGMSQPYKANKRVVPAIAQIQNNALFGAVNVATTTSTFSATGSQICAYRACTATSSTQFSETVGLDADF